MLAWLNGRAADL